MKVKDVIEYFYNGFDRVISGRYEGKEKRHFFYKEHRYELGEVLYWYEQMTPKQENLYKKHNSLLIERMDNEIRT